MPIFRPLIFKKVWLCIGMALVAAVIYLSLASVLPPYLHIAPDLKLGHMLAYAVLMLYFGQLLARAGIEWVFAGLFVVMGIILEYLQGMTGYRTFAWYDMFANFLGVSVGFILSKTRLVNAVEHLDRKIGASLQ